MEGIAIMKKTLQECKKIVAKDAGYLNWENAIENFFGTEYFTDLANKMYYEQSEWISVEDALPTINEIVHVWQNELTKGKLISNEEGKQLWHYENGITLTYEKPSHWQPLPNPPQI